MKAVWYSPLASPCPLSTLALACTRRADAIVRRFSLALWSASVAFNPQFSSQPVDPPTMVRSAVSLLLAAATALALGSTEALDKTLHGINYDLRQGPDWDSDKCKSASTIATELAALAKLTSNVRTYSLADCDVSPVLTNAKKLGMTVWLGVWVSEVESVYTAEVAALKTLISGGYIDDNVIGFNVGSEAVYRKDITAEQAITYYTQFKKVLSDNSITAQVSITDIVDILLEYPDIVSTVDVITANQFPFWEKIEASEAAAQFKTRFEPLVTLAKGKSIIISETGWPTGGYSANASVASADNAARYLNDFYSLATQMGWKYYYFAGLDSPWKATQAADNTTVEQYFGLMDSTGTLKSAYADLTFTNVTFAESSSDSSTSSDGSSTSPGTVHAGTSSSTGTTGGTTTSSGTYTASGSADTAAANSASSIAVSVSACLALVAATLMSM